MSDRERDDEYLWSGRGPASGDVERLEKLLGGEKLGAPLRARPRRRLPIAIGVAAIASAAAFFFSRQALPPLGWTAAVLPGVSADEVKGGVYEFSLDDPSPPDGWEQAIEDRLSELPPHTIAFQGRRVLVDFKSEIPLGLDEVVSRRGDFAIQEVVEASPFMQSLYARVAEGDPRAAELGVTAEIDGWMDDATGKQYRDWYLAGPSAEAIRTYAAEAAAADPRLKPDDEHVLAFEPMWRQAAEGEAMRWRSYHLYRAKELSNADIQNAFVYWNEVTNRPEVLAEFRPDAAHRFADLTERMTGRKIAILLDGQVSSAPVVMGRIDGGRTSITMGGGDPKQIEEEARALAEVLRASQHPLPVALRMVRLDVRWERLSDTQLQVTRIAIAGLFGLVVFLVLFVGEGRIRAIDPEVAPVRGRARRRSLPWVRLLVSGGAAAAAILAERIPVTSDIAWAELGGHPISLFALGIMPAISAFLLVELAALLVPRWRALRIGGPSARARLGSATAILTILLALAQSWMIADFMLSIPPMAHLSRPLLVVSFTAGAVVMTFLALVVSRYGLGNGFAVLLLTGHGALAYRVVDVLADGTADPARVLPLLAAIAATALATSWILRSRVRGPSPASSFRLPTAGVVPLAMLPALMGLFALTWPKAAARLGVWWEETAGRPGSGVLVELGFLLAAGVLFSWLFSRRSRLGNATASGARPRGFVIAVLVSIAYLALVALLGRWVADTLAYFGLALVSVAVATAMIMDLVAEWRALSRRDDLVPVWPLHQVQRVDLVTGALAKNEIDVHTRGLYLRLLLHFFGPFVPVLIYVPAAQADEARAIIRAQLEAT